ncbi:MAG: S8 family serine peptidase, partial [Chloroflexota bacterium]|nr:S8 family serine peptidase [Chloroflexota bacterium]
KIRARHLIFNLSLGIPATSRKGVDSAHLLNAINDVLRAENTFVVAAAGNTGVWDPKHAAASLTLTARDTSLAERRNVLAKVLQDPDAGGTYGWQGVAQDVPELPESNGVPPEEQDDVLGPRRVRAEEPAAYHKLREELAVEPNRSSYHGHAPDDLDVDLFQRRLFCVGASDQFDYTAIETAAFAPFSNRAPLVAPGLNVMLTSPDNGSNRFLIWNGTSFATPQVAGLVARMLAAGCPPDEISAILLGSGAPSTRLGQTSTAPERQYRHVDPRRALSCASAPDAF